MCLHELTIKNMTVTCSAALPLIYFRCSGLDNEQRTPVILDKMNVCQAQMAFQTWKLMCLRDPEIPNTSRGTIHAFLIQVFLTPHMNHWSISHTQPGSPTLNHPSHPYPIYGHASDTIQSTRRPATRIHGTCVGIACPRVARIHIEPLGNLFSSNTGWLLHQTDVLCRVP